MRILALLVILSAAVPSVASAHSGSVLKVAVNYLPMALAVVPIFWGRLLKLAQRLNPFATKKNDRQND